MWAETATYSLRNAGSLPRSTPTTLSDSIVLASIATLIRAVAGMANRGSTLPSVDSANSSLKVWPEPVKNRSARAGLMVTAVCWPRVSSNAGSAIASAGMNRDSFDRSHGMS